VAYLLNFYIFLMKYLFALPLIIILVFSSNSYSQNLFPNTFEDCNTERFALEMDTTTAKIADSKLISVITTGLDQQNLENVNGIMALQVIVELDGSSCLLSYDNRLNIEGFGSKLKTEIDKNLKWLEPSKKVAAIVSIRIQDGLIEFKRLGMGGDKGIHELQN